MALLRPGSHSQTPAEFLSELVMQTQEPNALLYSSVSEQSVTVTRAEATRVIGRSSRACADGPATVTETL